MKIDAKELITQDRLDIVAYMKYVEYKEKNYSLSFIKSICIAVYKLITPEEEFPFERYNTLIESIQLNGVDESAFSDGAFAVAVAAYHNLMIPVSILDNQNVRYDAAYFKEKSLNEDYLDFLITEYIRIKSDLFIVLVWPFGNFQKNQNVYYEQFNLISKIIYEKKFNLSYNGLVNLCLQVYNKSIRLKILEKRHLVTREKALECIDWNKPVTAIIIECQQGSDTVIKTKEEIRKIIKRNVMHSSAYANVMHATDNSDETLQVARVIFHKNSREVLNYIKPFIYFDFYKKIRDFYVTLEDNNLTVEDFALDCSRGLYEPYTKEKIEFITVSDPNTARKAENTMFVCNQADIAHYAKAPEEILFNPDNYFVFNEVKFIALSEDEKEHFHADNQTFYSKLFNKFIFLLAQTLRYIWETKLWVRNLFINLLRLTRTYNLIRKMVNKIRSA